MSERENFKPFTHEEMRNDVLSGDKIDVTSRSSQEDYEIDRHVGMDHSVNASSAEPEQEQLAKAESLVDLPLERQKI